MAKTRRRQRSGGGLITAAKIVFGLVLAAICACAGAWGTGFALTGEANPLKWTSSKPAELFPRTVAITNEGQTLTNGCTYDMPTTGFAFLSVQDLSAEIFEYVADGEITLTAEVDNEYINGKFDYTVDFKDTAAEWAQGKVASYYIGLEPIDDGRQVKVKYLAPFAEQIVLTATLQGTDSAASCTIDCLKTVTLENPDIGGADIADYLAFESYYNYGVGTVEGDFELAFFRLELKQNFTRYIENYLNFDLTFKSFNTSKAYSLDKSTALNRKPILVSDVEELKYQMFIEGFEDYDQDHKDAIYYAWYRAADDLLNLDISSNTVFDFGINYTYAGVVVLDLQESELNGALITGSYYGADVAPSVTLNKNYVF